MNQAIFEIKRNAVDRPFFVLKNPSQEVIIVSKSFADRIECERNITLIRENVGLSQISIKGDGGRNPRFEICEDPTGKYSFNLYSVEGNIILTSEHFAEIIALENCIEGLKNYAAHARIIDFL